jgi:S1-C subfamily serine protease
MMYFALIFTLLISSLSWAESCVKEEQLKKRMVLIEKFNRGKGSGVLYGGTTVLTNRHVIEDVDMPWVWVPKLQKSIRADILYQAPDKEADFAILKLRERVPNISILPLSKAPQKGEALNTLGFPFGKKYKLSAVTGTFKERIKIKGMTHPDAMLTVLSHDQTHSGDSGGGIFNCAGELAGIHFGNQAHIGKPKNSFGVHVSAIKRILKMHNIPTNQ